MSDETDLEQIVHRRIVRMNGVVWGLSLGVLGGLGLFVATNWLILKGGENVGRHLALLGHYLPGYEVSFAGSLIGLAWVFVLGFAATWLVSVVYNGVADRREHARRRRTRS